jgi:hypothetical protein
MINPNIIPSIRHTEQCKLVIETNIMIDYVFGTKTFEEQWEKIDKIIDKIIKKQALSKKLYYLKDKQLRQLGYLYYRDIQAIRNAKPIQHESYN